MIFGRWLAVGSIVAALGAGLAWGARLRGPALPRTVSEVVTPVLPGVREAWEPVCTSAGVSWPPERLQLLAFKEERSLEVWVAGARTRFVRLATYPVLAASGGPGPKRREGDRQVPEGFYGLPDLNPNSAFFLSLHVDYPNELDVAHARVPVSDLGGEIFVHGRSVSRGCLAIGDEAIEQVFALASLVPAGERRILIAPVDFRAGAAAPTPDEPWVGELYASMREALTAFPR